MNPRYAPVAERAAHRCEYCRAPEAIFNFPFEVEHIVPPGRGGADDESNWALSCRACNVHKSDHVEATDADTRAVVPLFHPRRHHWEQHFSVEENSGALFGLTAIGRATIGCLHMNQPAQLAARRQWMRLKIFPTF
jgi:5-methylcytosine-specific restriction endonuclease McrA